MVVGTVPIPVLGTLLVFLLATATAYLVKACMGYLLWWRRDPVAVDLPELEVLADEPVKVHDDERVRAARLSTLVPRWLVSSAAVESLSPPQLRCLLAHVEAHVQNRGRLVHNATFGLGITLVLLASQVSAALPGVVQRLVPVPGLLLAIGYVVVSVPIVVRWLLYRADRLAAADCGAETYLSFLETAARVDPPRPAWQGYFEPSPAQRAEKLRERLDTVDRGE